MSFMRSSVLFIALLLLSITAFCWGTTGHRVIAEVAQNHLSRKASREIRKLIGRRSLASWANWGDFIKSDSTWDFAEQWHYVDLPGHLEKQVFITDLKALPGKNLYTQIYAEMDSLRNGSLDAETRRHALYFLVHLVGDLHQPLHVGRSEDQGGNKITVYWFNDKSNLHTTWDSKLVDNTKYSFSEYAKVVDVQSEEQVKAWQSGTVEDWFYESHQLSDKIYDAAPAESKLDYKYIYKNQDMVDEQLAKGGIRLAELLNRVFD